MRKDGHLMELCRYVVLNPIRAKLVIQPRNWGWSSYRATAGKPNQNASIESFNGRFRDECLNEQWFLHLAHARAIIEAWRREYNEEQPKEALGGLTPAAYAQQLASKSATVAPGL